MYHVMQTAVGVLCRGGQTKFKTDFPKYIGTSRQGRCEKGLRPVWVIPWDRKEPGEFRGGQHTWCG